MVKKSLSNPGDSPSNRLGVSDLQTETDRSLDLCSDERWLLTQRVAQSETFRRAPRLRAFLLFIAERTLRNPVEQLSEYEIGMQVFERRPDFYPVEDSIVRSSARLLRAKLQEYFSAEGKEEPLFIQIPKGSYVPEFVPHAGGESPPIGGAERLLEHRIPVGMYVLLAVCLILLAACLLLWKDRAVATPPQAGRVSPANLISSVFDQPGSELHVVYPDSALVSLNDTRPSVLTLDEYIQLKDRDPRIGGALDAAVPGITGRRLITSFRDTAFGFKLSEQMAHEGRILTVRHARLMQARDFRSGNFLLLGSGYSDPWTSLFEAQLNFRFEMEAAPPGQRKFRIRNVSPQAGEAPFYWSSPEDARNGSSHARITLTPNLSGTGKVLMIAGRSAESSEGAEDAALAADLPRQFQALLRGRPLHDLSSFELLLEIHCVDGVARGANILAYRAR